MVTRTKKATKLPKKPGFLKSAERTLDVLEYMCTKDSIGVTELAAAKKIGVSTAHRILTTLVRRGFAARNPKTRRYSPGKKLKKLAKRY